MQALTAKIANVMERPHIRCQFAVLIKFLYLPVEFNLGAKGKQFFDCHNDKDHETSEANCPRHDRRVFEVASTLRDKTCARRA
jgi:hypothetical protein